MSSLSSNWATALRLLYPQSSRHQRQKYLLTVKGLALYNALPVDRKVACCEDMELTEEGTRKKIFLVRQEGKQQVQREIDHYYLDTTIALGNERKNQKNK